jgi:cytochrome c nitrite reductase small subunit
MNWYRLAIVAALLVGAALGVGAYTFVYAKGGSYLTNDPAACANCHIMNDHYRSWLKGSHRSVAVCNDCHTPKNLVMKYVTKAENGFRHSLGFTTGRFPDPLQITPGNYEITEHACRKCHTEITEAIDLGTTAGTERRDEELACVKCHRNVGHWVR